VSTFSHRQFCIIEKIVAVFSSSLQLIEISARIINQRLLTLHFRTSSHSCTEYSFTSDGYDDFVATNEPQTIVSILCIPIAT